MGLGVKGVFFDELGAQWSASLLAGKLAGAEVDHRREVEVRAVRDGQVR